MQNLAKQNKDTMTFIDKVKAYKNGDKQALDSIFNVVIDTKTHGISKILINDDELVKNYSYIISYYYGTIPHDELNQLFYVGLIKSMNKMEECKSNQEALSYVQRGIFNEIRKYKEKQDDHRKWTKGIELTKNERLHNKKIEQQQANNKYEFKYTNAKSDDYIASDSFDKFSSAETKKEFLDSFSLQKYNHNKCPTLTTEFLKYNTVESILTEAQMKVYRIRAENIDASDREIADVLGFSQQNVNKIWQTIRDKLNNSFDVFVKLNRHDTSRLTSEIIDLLDHIHKLKHYHNFADDDERLFDEVFDFIKKQYTYIDQSESNIHKFFKNKHTYTTTIEDVLSDNWTAAGQPSVNAQKALNKLENAIKENNTSGINKRDRGQLVMHVIAAFERYLMKYKNEIKLNARTNRAKRKNKN